ncbi:MAG: hypothetical protein RL226_832 [Bacteroidota bacterium]|jgi:hypothetical protein
MKDTANYLLVLLTAAVIILSVSAFSDNEPLMYEYKQISAVESIIPGGLGRSRLLTTDLNGTLVEKELKNFYSMVGINFGNISNNDAVIIERVNQYIAEGWELVHINSGVQSPSADNGQGIFITRYVFRRQK